MSNCCTVKFNNLPSLPPNPKEVRKYSFICPEIYYLLALSTYLGWDHLQHLVRSKNSILECIAAEFKHFPYTVPRQKIERPVLNATNNTPFLPRAFSSLAGYEKVTVWSPGFFIKCNVTSLQCSNTFMESIIILLRVVHDVFCPLDEGRANFIRMSLNKYRYGQPTYTKTKNNKNA